MTLPLNLFIRLFNRKSLRKGQSEDEPFFTTLRSTTESSVDILQQHDTPLRRVCEQMVELVVRQSSFGKIENTDVVFQLSSERLDERRLS